MVRPQWQSVEAIRDEKLRYDPAFRAYWEGTAVARAVALAVIGYRVEGEQPSLRGVGVAQFCTSG